ncbi:MAG: lasso peptide biosynthesis PqqD family chaperone [Actinomycetota bacterium]|nr:lasso peptide biosynthesis PqqD family chaperone [Actinomycetota bacterium]
MTLKLRAGVFLVDTDYGIAILDENSGQYFDLNPSGALILRTLLDGGTYEQAAQQLSTEYVVDPATASQDVTALLEEFRSAGLALP